MPVSFNGTREREAGHMKIFAALLAVARVLAGCVSSNAPASSVAPTVSATPGPPKVLTYVAIDAPSDLRLLNRQGANKPFVGPNGDQLVYVNPSDGKIRPG